MALAQLGKDLELRGDLIYLTLVFVLFTKRLLQREGLRGR